MKNNKEKDVLGEMILSYLRETYPEKMAMNEKFYPSTEKYYAEWAGKYGREAINKRFEEIFEMYL
jgi:hypothetical protein